MVIFNDIEQIAKVRPILCRFYAGSELIFLYICPLFKWLVILTILCVMSFESLYKDGNEQKILEFLFDLSSIGSAVQFCYCS